MRWIILFVFITTNIAYTSAQSEAAMKEWREIPAYQHVGVFKDSIYAFYTWQDFYIRSDIKLPINPNNIDISLFNACIFYASNKIREKNRKKPLSFNIQLLYPASMHSYLMVKQNFFSHNNTSNPQYGTMVKRIEFFGYKGQGIAENIAKAYLPLGESKSYIQLAEEVVNQLYNSPPHKANMLNPLYKEAAHASYFYSSPKGAYLYFVVTQNFGYR